MKKRGIDAAMEIDRLLEDYSAYNDAQIGFLLKQMIRENDRRQYEYKKKVEQVRQDSREGKGVFAEKRKQTRKFSGGIKAPWEIEKEKRHAEREHRLYGKDDGADNKETEDKTQQEDVQDEVKQSEAGPDEAGPDEVEKDKVDNNE